MFRPSIFEDDPFFGDHRDMMNNFFGSGFPSHDNAIGDRRGGGHSQDMEARRERGERRQRPVDPFEAMNQRMNAMMGGFGMMGNMMGNMDMSSVNDNGAHVYTQSSVYSYSSDGQGPPKVFQAAREERRAPGGVKETKKALKDSTTGVQKMAVGHHLGERGHVIERSQNFHTGEREERQDFVGMNEDEGSTFHDEWARVAGAHAPHASRGIENGGRQRRGNRQQTRTLPIVHHPRDDMLLPDGRNHGKK